MGMEGILCVRGIRSYLAYSMKLGELFAEMCVCVWCAGSMVNMIVFG